MLTAEPCNPKRSWTRLDGVDLLRGLAIFFVLMNHVNMRLRGVKLPYTDGLPHQLVSSLVWKGQQGVQIFFAISGFLITSTALRRWGQLSQVKIRDFYLLRFARIAPLLLALLGLLTICDLIHVKYFVISSKTGGLGRALFAALTFHVNVLEAQRGYLPGSWDILWSLSVEEMFYLFFPLLSRLLGRGKMLIWLLLTFVAMGPFARTVLTHGNGVWKEYSYLGGMDAIALGCLTALFLSRARLSRPVLLAVAGAGTALLIFTLGFSIRADALGLDRTGLNMTIVAAATCMVVAASAQTKWRIWAVFQPLLSLGQRSYEVYLTHMFVVFALFQLFLITGRSMKAVPVLFLAVILISGLLGDGIARLYSEPMNRMLRKRWGNGPERLGSVVQNASEQSCAEHVA